MHRNRFGAYNIHRIKNIFGNFSCINIYTSITTLVTKKPTPQVPNITKSIFKRAQIL